VTAGNTQPVTSDAVSSAIASIYDRNPHFVTIKDRGAVYSDYVVPKTGFCTVGATSSFNQPFSLQLYINNSFAGSMESLDYISNNFSFPCKQGDIIRLTAPNDPNWFREYIYVGITLFY
jgi:hypothetical protein